MSDADDDDHSESPESETGQPNAADAVQVRKRESARQRAERESAGFWRNCLSTPIGRRELWKFIAVEAHAFEDRFACGPNGFPQTEATWFQAGEGSLGLRLYHQLLRLDPQGVFTMLAENDSKFANVLLPRPGGK